MATIGDVPYALTVKDREDDKNELRLYRAPGLQPPELQDLEDFDESLLKKK